MENRREFLKKMTWSGAALAAAGCVGPGKSLFSRPDTMCGFAAPPMDRIRIGIIGTGGRGTTCGLRFAQFEGVEIAALCDLRPEGPDPLCSRLKEIGHRGAMKRYVGSTESYKGLCDDPDVDVVYITTPAKFHTEQELYAMRAGKHVFTEVPGAQGEEQCWEIVETCEKTRRHCMMLENCLYGEEEMLAFTLCHKGILGTLTHGEGSYIHNLTWRNLADSYRNRLKHYDIAVSRGNHYPTHGLGPICAYMDVNRGDKMDYVVSISSKSAAYREYAAQAYPPNAWQNTGRIETGDMNTSIIRTAKGRTIMMQVDQVTPRPYSRINLIQGTKGCFYDYPLRITFGPHAGGPNFKDPGEAWKGKGHEWFDEKRLEEVKREYMHPLYKMAGEVAKKVGGHGGMDFMMDLRWIYCLENGLPLDMDVYDLASWSSIVPCSAESDRRGGEPVEIPDFTRGGWKTAKPVEIGAVDLARMGYKGPGATDDKAKIHY